MGFEEMNIWYHICDTETYFTTDFRQRHPDRVRAFYQSAWPTHSKLPDYLQLCIARHNFEATHRLREVKVPTLVVVGDADVGGSNHVPQSEVLANPYSGSRIEDS